MASRIIHLAISKEIAKQWDIREPNRFFVGSMLPDAAVSGNSHRKITVFGGVKKTYDLTGFRNQFYQSMQKDSLYLGFYFHLVQDLVFRNYVYETHHWDPRPEGNVARLHRDYAIINSHVIRRYQLNPHTILPERLEDEPLLKDCQYRLEEFFRDFTRDFQPAPPGEIFFFREEMADGFISLAVRQCVAELEALKTGSSCLDELHWAWNR